MAADSSSFRRNLQQHGSRVKAAALQAMNLAGEKVIADAKVLCPVDTGFLAASGTTEPAKMVGEKVTKTVGFGAAYAAAVHENLKARHDPPTQAKYLETAMRANAPKIKEFIAEAVRQAEGGQ